MSVPGYTIRLAHRPELPAVHEIERRARAALARRAEAFGKGSDAASDPRSLEELTVANDDGRLWVAAHDSEIVGFALLSELGLFAHLEELEVLPAHGRQGLGTELLEAACSWAGSRGFSAVTHAGFHDLEWNLPFYLEHGFLEVPASELPPELIEIVRRDRRQRLGSDPRVLLQRDV
jgi:GNAT superfamily N-acetyltransferase